MNFEVALKEKWVLSKLTLWLEIISYVISNCRETVSVSLIVWCLLLLEYPLPGPTALHTMNS